MKELGSSKDSVIVEMTHNEYESLCRIAGYDWDNHINRDMEAVLYRLSITKLAHIIWMLRDTADRLEKPDDELKAERL